jgi:RNA-directed DNA polymerase
MFVAENVPLYPVAGFSPDFTDTSKKADNESGGVSCQLLRLSSRARGARSIAIVRRRSWEYDWVIKFDIKSLFDNIDHELLMRALRNHCQTPWVLLYVERWLKAPMLMPDGELVERTKDTPQGGVVSPLLANLFLHYAFDSWIGRYLRSVRFCRYADDGVMHCRSLA